MNHPCKNCAAMALENRRLRSQVESLKSEIDAEKSRTHDAGERFRRANAAYAASMRCNAREYGKA